MLILLLLPLLLPLLLLAERERVHAAALVSGLVLPSFG